ncbi:MAG TPA: hypothetical protein VFZ68_08460 [Acidimicrobiales bacterium]
MPEPPDMGHEPEPLPRRPGSAPGEPDVPGVEPLASSKRGRWIVAIIVVLLLIGLAVALAVATDDNGDERTTVVPALIATGAVRPRPGSHQTSAAGTARLRGAWHRASRPHGDAAPRPRLEPARAHK